MKKRLVWLIPCLLLLVLLVFAGTHGISAEKTGLYDLLKWKLNQKSGLPVYSGTVLTGVKEPVQIYFDDYAVPHIFAQSEADMIYAQGYVQAMERIFQMDLIRRLIAGRLSEVVGPRMLESDRFYRTIGFYRAAEKSLGACSAETRMLAGAYCAGVNDYLKQNKDNLPPEFILLDYIPEDWRPVDAIAISKLIAWELSGNMDTELLLGALVDEVGMEKAAELFPSYPEDGLTILGSAGPGGGISSGAALELLGLAAAGPFPHGLPGIGSNNWVISSSRSATGGALLASDMHLSLDLPSIWYMNYLSIPGQNVTGVMFPGIPGVISGFNDHIAWGETNLGPDVMDLYQIKFSETDDRRYLYKDEWLEAAVYEETIKVRGSADDLLRIRETCFGPVITDVVDLAPGDYPLSLRWTGLDATPEADAMLGMMRAANFEEFRTALRGFMCPAQNFVYADVEGNIGYLGNGLFPIRSESHRTAGNGLLPVPGWTDDYAWTGWVPWEEIPSLYNPPAGLIVTANHKAVDDDYPYFLSYEWAHPSRALSIQREYAGNDRITLEDLQDGQACFYNSQAAGTAPQLVEILSQADLSVRETEALDLLAEYAREPVDAAGSAGAAIYHTFYACLANNLFAGQISEQLLGRLLGCSTIELERLITAGSSRWYSDSDALLAQSLRDAVSRLGDFLGGEPPDWEWGKIHTLTFNHHLGADVSKRLYDRGPFLVGGSGNTPGALGYMRTLELPFDVLSGAPWRYVVDMSDHTAFDMLAIGNSGHIRSAHYADLLEDWLGMRYKPRLFDRAAIEALDRVLILEPRG